MDNPPEEFRAVCTALLGSVDKESKESLNRDCVHILISHDVEGTRVVTINANVNGKTFDVPALLKAVLGRIDPKTERAGEESPNE